MWNVKSGKWNYKQKGQGCIFGKFSLVFFQEMWYDISINHIFGKEHKMIVEIFTDGACSGNPGPGGYGAILRYGNAEKELSGGNRETTNNRMELMGVIAALSALNRPCEVVLTTDSKYVCDSITKGWVYGWQKKGWKKSDGKPALNVDLWEQLLPLLARHKVTFCWVKGHAGHPENERCDALAVAQRDYYSSL